MDIDLLEETTFKGQRWPAFFHPLWCIARMHCPLRWHKCAKRALSTALRSDGAQPTATNHDILVLAQRLPDCVANCHNENIPFWDTQVETIPILRHRCEKRWLPRLSDPRGSTRESASGRAPQLSSLTRNYISSMGKSRKSAQIYADLCLFQTSKSPEWCITGYQYLSIARHNCCSFKLGPSNGHFFIGKGLWLPGRADQGKSAQSTSIGSVGLGVIAMGWWSHSNTLW